MQQEFKRGFLICTCSWDVLKSNIYVVYGNCDSFRTMYEGSVTMELDCGRIAVR